MAETQRTQVAPERYNAAMRADKGNNRKLRLISIFSEYRDRLHVSHARPLSKSRRSRLAELRPLCCSLPL
ncbi:uncharacterized protein V6R79_015201 [Siganus canaliculatus]